MEFPNYTGPNHVETTAWSRFICKASRGSYKAVIMLTWAEITFIAERLGYTTANSDQITPEVYDAELANLIQPTLPFDNQRDFCQLLAQWDILPHEKVSNDSHHAREFYDNLWNQSRAVDEIELTIDAAIHCFNHWSGEHYQHLAEIEDEANYNSLDVVAAMLFLITWRELSKTT